MAVAELSAPPPRTTYRDPVVRPWTPDEFARIQQYGLFAGRDVTLVGDRLFEGPAPLRANQEDFQALWDEGFFRDRKVQLIDGEILQESVMNPPHATSVMKCYMVLSRIFTQGCHVRPQLPIELTPYTKVFPDGAVVAGSIDDYATKNPTTAILVLEVSDATRPFDRREKASLYAAAGLAEYWMVDLVKRKLLAYRNPHADPSQPHGHSYAEVKEYGPEESVSPLAAPHGTVKVADLLP